VGRTDLPFSSHEDLLASARSVLERCSDDTVLLSGHGPATTVGHERTTNPFLADLHVPAPTEHSLS
jgi:glyoxylase-like metal-dependent hydrolase (beta-lactamase superfamily II)